MGNQNTYVFSIGVFNLEENALKVLFFFMFLCVIIYLDENDIFHSGEVIPSHNILN